MRSLPSHNNNGNLVSLTGNVINSRIADFEKDLLNFTAQYNTPPKAQYSDYLKTNIKEISEVVDSISEAYVMNATDR